MIIVITYLYNLLSINLFYMRQGRFEVRKGQLRCHLCKLGVRYNYRLIYYKPLYNYIFKSYKSHD